MTTELIARPDFASAYTPVSRDAVLAEAFACILSGRPFPESLRAPSPARRRPATVAEGIGAIMADPRGA